MSFESLNLSPKILRAINEHGYNTPTPIQAASIPTILSGVDLMAMAQTGTGKTAGFVLPILQQLSTTNAKPLPPGCPKILVIVPTRELALQVLNSVHAYGKYMAIHTMSMIGGVNIRPQIMQLRKKIDIVVATPGRLLDHVKQRTVNLSHVNVLVLDEADRILDMGFIDDIRRIMALLPQKRQNLLFSATFSTKIKALANSLLNNPEVIEVAKQNTTSETITHKVHPVDTNKKKELLAHLIIENNWHQALVFTKTKYGADNLAKYLNTQGLLSLAIHGDKSQANRISTLNKFKKGSLQILVATDIAARGLDIVDLPYVVNFDLPKCAEDYVHRIGRTGRAGQSGYAVSLVAPSERGLKVAIERLINQKIFEEVVPGFEVTPTPKDTTKPRTNKPRKYHGEKTAANNDAQKKRNRRRKPRNKDSN